MVHTMASLAPKGFTEKWIHRVDHVTKVLPSKPLVVWMCPRRMRTVVMLVTLYYKLFAPRFCHWFFPRVQFHATYFGVLRGVPALNWGLGNGMRLLLSLELIGRDKLSNISHLQLQKCIIRQHIYRQFWQKSVLQSALHRSNIFHVYHLYKGN